MYFLILNRLRTVSSLFLSVILITGTITALSFSSSFMINVQAQPSYSNNYKSQDTNVNINKIKCINDNVNINGVNSGDVNAGNKGQGYLGANSYGSGYYAGYDKKQGKDFDCVINNNNTNTNINIVRGGDNQTIPPEPEPEPTPATLTVKKQVFGCNIIRDPTFMNCLTLQNNPSAPWINCNNNINPDFNRFCQSLPESIFDIEVLDDQNNQIQQFVGSEQGTTIQNLQPGTYTVNEIEHLSGNDQLIENPPNEALCTSAGFPDGGVVFNSTATIIYAPLCFEYEDEQGNNCNTITLAAGESRTCIVKNYIRLAQDI